MNPARTKHCGGAGIREWGEGEALEVVYMERVGDCFQSAFPKSSKAFALDRRLHKLKKVNIPV